MTENDYNRICVDDSHLRGGCRLDKLLAAHWREHSRVAMQALIRGGGVSIDGVVCRRASQPVAAGRWLRVDFSALPPPPPSRCAPEALPLDIVHEDGDLLVVNKAAGMVVHPGHGNYAGTLMAALLHHHDSAGLTRGGIVHRLDKETSGLLVVAKTAAAQRRLIAQFKRRDIGREYLALVHGSPPPTGVVDLPIGRQRQAPTRMAARFSGKPAITRFSVEKRWRGFSLLRCRLETGRTHQIRVHLEHSGYPVVGDAVYRRRARPHALPLRRQALHAETLRLCHPASGESLSWRVAPPADMQAAICQLDEAAAVTT